MRITRDFSEYKPWSGAVDTFDKIVEAGKLDEFEQLLEECFCEDVIDEVQVNDVLWFDSEWVLESLGLQDTEEDLATDYDVLENEVFDDEND